MDRRQFIGVTLGTVAAACAPRFARPPPRSLATGPLDAAAFVAERRYAATPYGRIAYVERGHGPVALFLHGFPLNGFQWRGALERLAPHRRCLAPDFLGLGYTEVAPGQQDLSPGIQAAMLESFLDELGVHEVDVVANDSGGAVAQLLVARNPGRVRSLLLTNCDTEKDCPPPALLPVITMAREGTYVDRWLRPWLADKVLARSPEGLGGMTFTHPENPTDEAVDLYLAPLVASPERTHAYTLGLEGNALSGAEPSLGRFTRPVRILWGTGDTIFASSSPEYLSGLFPGSRGVRRLDGAKLFFPEEFPDVIAAEARALWGIP